MKANKQVAVVEPEEQFVELKPLLLKLEAKLAEDNYQDHQSAALWHLFTTYEDKIGKLPPWYFHKAFRQTDVIIAADDGHIDMAIWHLLNGAKTFWAVFTEMYFKDEEGEK